jgi:phosphonopyruvate decarboxylase
MLSPEKFYWLLVEQGITFFTGVPDSLLKNFLSYLQDAVEPPKHIIAANEGLAITLAAGHHLATGKVPMIYMQNSGLGNAINPLTSIADKTVFSIPLVLLIGWRGIPGQKDEPQHKKMGLITQNLLNVLEIPCFVLDADEEQSFTATINAIQTATTLQQPVALLAKPSIFENYDTPLQKSSYTLSRISVLKKIAHVLKGDELVVCTTGKTGREWNDITSVLPNTIQKKFLCTGGMGLANHIALGINLFNESKTIMLDGDGAVLMHMGALPTVAEYSNKSFIHIVINNGSHQSVGGQPTLGFRVNFTGIASNCGYPAAFLIETAEQLNHWLQNNFGKKEKQFVEIRVNEIEPATTSRPEGLPTDWKKELMNVL